MTLEDIQALRIQEGGFHRLLNMQPPYLDEQGRLAMKMELTDQMLNPHGIAHGGAIFALCDTVAGTYATLNRSMPLTMEGSIHYYRPALPGSMITATVNARKEGKSICVLMVETCDEQGRHIADATFSMFYKN